MSTLSPTAARRIYPLLSSIAWCDGELAEEERFLLLAFQEDLGLSEAEAKELEAKGTSLEGLELGDEELELAYLVDGLIEIALADGVIQPEERARLAELASLIDTPDLVQRMEDRVQQRAARRR